MLRIQTEHVSSEEFLRKTRTRRTQTQKVTVDISRIDNEKIRLRKFDPHITY